MDRIRIDREAEKGRKILLEGPPLEALRFQGGRAGSLITVTDRQGNDFRGRVLSLSENEASVFLFDVFPSSTESGSEIILLQALPGKERMELIVQKTTELGISAIFPFKSERSISLEERESKQKKAHRWQEIALKAVQQSRRARVPLVGDCRSFEDVLEGCKEEGLKILLWEKEGEALRKVLTDNKFGVSNSKCGMRNAECGVANSECGMRNAGSRITSSEFGEEKENPLKKVLNPPSRRIYVMVGPEGGFTEREVDAAKDKGFIPVKLGQRILRTETAAIVLVGILQYELGDLS